MTDVVVTHPIQLPAKRKPGPRNAADVPKVGRITLLVRNACQLMHEHGLTITETAERLNCSRPHLSNMLNRPYIKDYFARIREREVLGPDRLAQASFTFNSMLRSQSDKIKLEVSERMLTESGTLSRKEGRSTHIGVAVQVGYTVDWNPESQAIAAKAEVIED